MGKSKLIRSRQDVIVSYLITLRMGGPVDLDLDLVPPNQHGDKLTRDHALRLELPVVDF